MEQPNRESGNRAEVGRGALAKAVFRAVGAEPQAASAPTFLRLNCSLCGNSFVLDMQEAWDSPQEEIEVEGREFLGIRQDSVLCPRCLHFVEVTGADRVYWRLSDC